VVNGETVRGGRPRRISDGVVVGVVDVVAERKCAVGEEGNFF
jgi:hypothetical protein